MNIQIIHIRKSLEDTRDLLIKAGNVDYSRPSPVISSDTEIRGVPQGYNPKPSNIPDPRSVTPNYTGRMGMTPGGSDNARPWEGFSEKLGLSPTSMIPNATNEQFEAQKESGKPFLVSPGSQRGPDLINDPEWSDELKGWEQVLNEDKGSGSVIPAKDTSPKAYEETSFVNQPAMADTMSKVEGVRNLPPALSGNKSEAPIKPQMSGQMVTPGEPQQPFVWGKYHKDIDQSIPDPTGGLIPKFSTEQQAPQASRSVTPNKIDLSDIFANEEFGSNNVTPKQSLSSEFPRLPSLPNQGTKTEVAPGMPANPSPSTYGTLVGTTGSTGSTGSTGIASMPGVPSQSFTGGTNPIGNVNPYKEAMGARDAFNYGTSKVNSSITPTSGGWGGSSASTPSGSSGVASTSPGTPGAKGVPRASGNTSPSTNQPSASTSKGLNMNDLSKGLIMGPGFGFGGHHEDDDLREYMGTPFEAKAMELNAKQCRFRAEQNEIPSVFDLKPNKEGILAKDPNEKKRKDICDKLRGVRSEWMRLHADMLEWSAKELRASDDTQKSLNKAWIGEDLNDRLRIFMGTQYQAQALECMAKEQELESKIGDLASIDFQGGIMIDPDKDKRSKLREKIRDCQNDFLRLQAKLLKEQAKAHRKYGSEVQKSGFPESQHKPLPAGEKKEYTPLLPYKKCTDRKMENRFDGDMGTEFDVHFFHKAQAFKELTEKMFS